MQNTTRANILRRIEYVEGHVEGIRRMVARDEPCPRVLLQAYAVRRAIQTIELKLLERHLRDCLRTGTRDEQARKLQRDAARLLVHRRGGRPGRRPDETARSSTAAAPDGRDEVLARGG